MIEAEKAIRDALAAGPTPGPWLDEGMCARSGSPDYFTVANCENDNPYMAENAACNPAAMTELLAEIDRLRGAIIQEREACAKLCETFEPKDDVDSGPELAAAIRGRGAQ